MSKVEIGGVNTELNSTIQQFNKLSAAYSRQSTMVRELAKEYDVFDKQLKRIEEARIGASVKALNENLKHANSVQSALRQEERALESLRKKYAQLNASRDFSNVKAPAIQRVSDYERQQIRSSANRKVYTAEEDTQHRIGTLRDDARSAQSIREMRASYAEVKALANDIERISRIQTQETQRQSKELRQQIHLKAQINQLTDESVAKARAQQKIDAKARMMWARYQASEATDPSKADKIIRDASKKNEIEAWKTEEKVFLTRVDAQNRIASMERDSLNRNAESKISASNKVASIEQSNAFKVEQSKQKLFHDNAIAREQLEARTNKMAQAGAIKVARYREKAEASAQSKISKLEEQRHQRATRELQRELSKRSAMEIQQARQQTREQMDESKGNIRTLISLERTLASEQRKRASESDKMAISNKVLAKQREYMRQQQAVIRDTRTLTDVNKMAQSEILSSWKYAIHNQLMALVRRTVISVVSQIQTAFRTVQESQIQATRIQTISQKSQLPIDGWLEGIRKISDAYGTEIPDVGEGVYKTISNQVARGTEAIYFMNDAMDLAMAGVASADEAVNALTGTMNAFGYSTANTKEIAASLMKTVELGRVTLGEMSDETGRYGTLAYQLGIGMNEVNAAIATMTIQGNKFNVAATQMRNLLLKLIKPTDHMKQFFKDIGVSSGEEAIADFGFEGVLKKMSDRVEKYGASEIGNLVGRVQAMSAVASLIRDKTGLYSKNLAEYGQGTGEYYRAVTDVMSSEGRAWQIEMNKVKNFFEQDLGNTGLHTVVTVTEKFGGLTNVIKNGLLPVLGSAVSLVASNKLRGFATSTANLIGAMRVPNVVPAMEASLQKELALHQQLVAQNRLTEASQVRQNANRIQGNILAEKQLMLERRAARARMLLNTAATIGITYALYQGGKMLMQIAEIEAEYAKVIKPVREINRYNEKSLGLINQQLSALEEQEKKYKRNILQSMAASVATLNTEIDGLTKDLERSFGRVTKFLELRIKDIEKAIGTVTGQLTESFRRTDNLSFSRGFNSTIDEMIDSIGKVDEAWNKANKSLRGYYDAFKYTGNYRLQNRENPTEQDTFAMRHNAYTASLALQQGMAETLFARGDVAGIERARDIYGEIEQRISKMRDYGYTYNEVLDARTQIINRQLQLEESLRQKKESELKTLRTMRLEQYQQLNELEDINKKVIEIATSKEPGDKVRERNALLERRRQIVDKVVKEDPEIRNVIESINLTYSFKEDITKQTLDLTSSLDHIATVTGTGTEELKRQVQVIQGLINANAAREELKDLKTILGKERDSEEKLILERLKIARDQESNVAKTLAQQLADNQLDSLAGKKIGFESIPESLKGGMFKDLFGAKETIGYKLGGLNYSPSGNIGLSPETSAIQGYKVDYDAIVGKISSVLDKAIRGGSSVSGDQYKQMLMMVQLLTNRVPDGVLSLDVKTKETLVKMQQTLITLLNINKEAETIRTSGIDYQPKTVALTDMQKQKEINLSRSLDELNEQLKKYNLKVKRAEDLPGVIDRYRQTKAEPMVQQIQTFPMQIDTEYREEPIIKAIEKMYRPLDEIIQANRALAMGSQFYQTGMSEPSFMGSRERMSRFKYESKMMRYRSDEWSKMDKARWSEVGKQFKDSWDSDNKTAREWSEISDIRKGPFIRPSEEDLARQVGTTYKPATMDRIRPNENQLRDWVATKEKKSWFETSPNLAITKASQTATSVQPDLGAQIIAALAGFNVNVENNVILDKVKIAKEIQTVIERNFANGKTAKTTR